MIVCHYSEIALKGKNRAFFEKKLVDQIKRVLPGKKVKRISGRIIIEDSENTKGLNKVFGISYFAIAKKCSSDIKEIKRVSLGLLKEKKFKTFRISARRADKDFPLSSREINEKVGEYILKKIKGIKVKLKKPDIACFIDIVGNSALLYLKKRRGPGGLPVGSSGKAVSLISGGIDSPVSSFYTLKRGVELIYVHFHSYPYTSDESIKKVKRIIEKLSQYQGKTKLYLIPFEKIQKEILLKTNPKYRVVLYRRQMMKIAEKIAKKEKALALVTGESIGQVSSQTLWNIRTIDQAVKLPVFRPLIGYDKEEIVNAAKKIKTFDISIIPDQDCCSLFIPKHPGTKIEVKQVLEQEKKLRKTLDKAEMLVFSGETR